MKNCLTYKLTMLNLLQRGGHKKYLRHLFLSLVSYYHAHPIFPLYHSANSHPDLGAGICIHRDSRAAVIAHDRAGRRQLGGGFWPSLPRAKGGPEPAHEVGLVAEVVLVLMPVDKGDSNANDHKGTG